MIYFIFKNYLDGWMGGCKRQIKDCLQQLKTKNYQSFISYFKTTWMGGWVDVKERLRIAYSN